MAITADVWDSAVNTHRDSGQSPGRQNILYKPFGAIHAHMNHNRSVRIIYCVIGLMYSGRS